MRTNWNICKRCGKQWKYEHLCRDKKSAMSFHDAPTAQEPDKGMPVTCGYHPGMSCIEAHLDDKLQIDALTQRVAELEKEILNRRKEDILFAENLKIILDENLALRAAGKKLRQELKSVYSWFEEMRDDHHSKLVENQTFESASENWDKLLQKPLEMKPIKQALDETASLFGEKAEEGGK